MSKLKKAHKSKTIQVAVAIALLGVAETQFHLIKNLIPEEYQGLVLITIGMVMAYLRVITTTSLEDKQ